jgi:hypothetical protein
MLFQPLQLGLGVLRSSWIWQIRTRLPFSLQCAPAYLPVFETALMYRGVRPDLPPAQTYGISTFELGWRLSLSMK